MSRFDAATRDARQALIEDGIQAHRERPSEFCTFEADASAPKGESIPGIPWVQCSGDQTSFDSTEAELDRVKSLLESYPRYQIEKLHRPEDADGVHVIVDTPGEVNRRAQFVDELFIDVFERPESYRLWARTI